MAQPIKYSILVILQKIQDIEDYHLDNECVKEYVINVVNVNSNDNVTDLFTKGLCLKIFCKMLNLN